MKPSDIFTGTVGPLCCIDICQRVVEMRFYGFQMCVKRSDLYRGFKCVRYIPIRNVCLHFLFSVIAENKKLKPVYLIWRSADTPIEGSVHRPAEILIKNCNYIRNWTLTCVACRVLHVRLQSLIEREYLSLSLFPVT